MGTHHRDALSRALRMRRAHTAWRPHSRASIISSGDDYVERTSSSTGRRAPRTPRTSPGHRLGARGRLRSLAGEYQHRRDAGDVVVKNRSARELFGRRVKAPGTRPRLRRIHDGSSCRTRRRPTALSAARRSRLYGARPSAAAALLAPELDRQVEGSRRRKALKGTCPRWTSGWDVPFLIADLDGGEARRQTAFTPWTRRVLFRSSAGGAPVTLPAAAPAEAGPSAIRAQHLWPVRLARRGGRSFGSATRIFGFSAERRGKTTTSAHGTRSTRGLVDIDGLDDRRPRSRAALIVYIRSCRRSISSPSGGFWEFADAYRVPELGSFGAGIERPELSSSRTPVVTLSTGHEAAPPDRALCSTTPRSSFSTTGDDLDPARASVAESLARLRDLENHLSSESILT